MISGALRKVCVNLFYELIDGHEVKVKLSSDHLFYFCKNGQILFYINYMSTDRLPETPNAFIWVNYPLLWKKFNIFFSLNEMEIKNLLTYIFEKFFRIEDIEVLRYITSSEMLENAFDLVSFDKEMAIVKTYTLNIR